MTVPTAVDSATTSAAPAIGTPGIGREMAKGTGWTILTRVGVQAIGFVSTIILARLLVPADFGLVTLAGTFSAALAVISEFSLDVVLIQNQQATREHYDTAWTFSVCRNFILAICLVVAAPWMAATLGDARIEAIVRWLAVALAIGGFYNIGIVNFRKELAFHKDLAFNVVQKLVSFAITVPLAFAWRDYWALVAGIVGGSFGQFVLSYLFHSYRPRFSLARWREIMHFSKWLVVNNVVLFLYGRSDTFVIGKMAGVQSVGIYGIAFEIANLTSSNFLAPLRRAIFPAYAKVSNDRESLREGLRRRVCLCDVGRYTDGGRHRACRGAVSARYARRPVAPEYSLDRDPIRLRFSRPHQRGKRTDFSRLSSPPVSHLCARRQHPNFDPRADRRHPRSRGMGCRLGGHDSGGAGRRGGFHIGDAPAATARTAPSRGELAAPRRRCRDGSDRHRATGTLAHTQHLLWLEYPARCRRWRRRRRFSDFGVLLVDVVRLVRRRRKARRQYTG